MEARDLGDTITLYLPHATDGRLPFVVLQERQNAGAFATRGESVTFALTLAQSLHSSRKVPVRMRVEDDAGNWVTSDAVATQPAAAE